MATATVRPRGAARSAQSRPSAAESNRRDVERKSDDGRREGDRSAPRQPRPRSAATAASGADRLSSGPQVIVADGDRYTPDIMGRGAQRRAMHRGGDRSRGTHRERAESDATGADFDDAEELVREARHDVDRLARERDRDRAVKRRRVDWKAYRGPAMPLKRLRGLRRKQDERERKERELARVTGMRVPKQRSRQGRQPR